MTVPDNELIDRLRKRYTVATPPPCSVCGAELRISSMGGGRQTWACSTTLSNVSDGGLKHYAQSQWTCVVGDPDVIELISRYQASAS
ncbi:hypothetical protein SEA_REDWATTLEHOG_101 [Gordonia phage RedWattleHog]|uniref:Uncharacterized protein n=1 Tax=Gordonia phage Stormageddon TaxID=2656541 RepID=A0A649VR20_9CAUD|nr:hypothetical protein KHQ86_gp201 [Gordonia phage Stormageddon]QGJ94960.1 hypothetical protein SEA_STORMAGEDDON_99 [Gordonia phage Stormageddon]QLF83604.1 hypothetical protein SEA_REDWATTLEHOG_101 [Gordonia phage RedWattleHog]